MPSNWYKKYSRNKCSKCSDHSCSHSQKESLYQHFIRGCGGTRWRSWLRHCVTSRKVASSIPDGVIGIFHWHNSSGRTVAVGLTQPLIGIFPGGKGGRCVGLTTLPPPCADCLEIWDPQTPGTLRVCSGLYRDCFTFTIWFQGLETVGMSHKWYCS